MSLPTQSTPACSALYASVPALPPNPVFEGEMRVKALRHLGQAVTERRSTTVMQLLTKDPSLAFEQVEFRGSGATAQPMEFPLACLYAGLSAGYVFAISRGFPVDAPLAGGSTTLLQAALTMAPTGRTIDSDVSLLLGLGADPKSIQSKEALYSAFAAAYPAKSKEHRPGAVSMLLDAKVKFEFEADTLCPYSMLVTTGGWETPEGASDLLSMMAKLAKSGHDPSLKTGSPRQSPIQRALGQKNAHALISLIRIGARVDTTALNGSDLLSILQSNGMKDFKPLVQEALMEAQISASTRAHDAELRASGAASMPAVPNARRRRAGAI